MTITTGALAAVVSAIATSAAGAIIGNVVSEDISRRRNEKRESE
jgi:hypothetical protein